MHGDAPTINFESLKKITFIQGIADEAVFPARNPRDATSISESEVLIQRCLDIGGKI